MNTGFFLCNEHQKGVEIDPPVKTSLEGCASGNSRFKGCTLCEKACRFGAIHNKGGTIAFDEMSCTGCGACVSVCPLSCFRMENDIYSRMGYLLNPPNFECSKQNRKILLFACSHSVHLLEAAGTQRIKYPAVLPLFVPDLSCISENHILRAFDIGADGVIILGCDEFTGHNNEETWRFAQMMLDEFGLKDRVIIIRNNKDMKNLTRSMISFGENLTQSPIRMHKQVLLENKSNRQILIELISSLASKTGIVPRMIIENANLPFAEISIGTSCTVCGACTSMCPVGSLKREAGSITSIYGSCIGCGLCEQACPEKAILIKRVFAMSRLPDREPSVLFKSELRKCLSCQKPYMTETAFDRITRSFIKNARDDIGPQEQLKLVRSQIDLLQFCENCRPARALLKMELLS